MVRSPSCLSGDFVLIGDAKMDNKNEKYGQMRKNDGN